MSARTGVEIASFVIGPGREVLDTYDDWARMSEVSDSGCVLVRPDTHVAWRCAEVADDPAAELARVMEQILGLVPATAADGVAVVGGEHPGGRTAEELQATES